MKKKKKPGDYFFRLSLETQLKISRKTFRLTKLADPNINFLFLKSQTIKFVFNVVRFLLYCLRCSMSFCFLSICVCLFIYTRGIEITWHEIAINMKKLFWRRWFSLEKQKFISISEVVIIKCMSSELIHMYNAWDTVFRKHTQYRTTYSRGKEGYNRKKERIINRTGVGGFFSPSSLIRWNKMNGGTWILSFQDLLMISAFEITELLYCKQKKMFPFHHCIERVIGVVGVAP